MSKNWKYPIKFFGCTLIIFMMNIVYAEEIAGVYKYRFKNGTPYGETYMSEDILEIVPVSKNTIYFKEKLECANGCRCEVYGLAKYTKENLFLFSDKKNNSSSMIRKESPCFLKIIPESKGIRIVSSGDCKEYCGVRGILDNDNFTYDKRRKIRYMTLLKNSKEYQTSIENLDKVDLSEAKMSPF